MYLSYLIISRREVKRHIWGDVAEDKRGNNDYAKIYIFPSASKYQGKNLEECDATDASSETEILLQNQSPTIMSESRPETKNPLHAERSEDFSVLNGHMPLTALM